MGEDLRAGRPLPEKMSRCFLQAVSDPAGRFSILAALLLILAVYLPTTVADYVPQDQWRAFRYDLEAQPTLAHLKRCKRIVSQFYLHTGRPLVWWGECLEHVLVEQIADFRPLRTFCLLFVLASACFLSVAFLRVGIGWWLSCMTAGLLLVSYGYSFMYLQGLTALPVLCAVPLAAGSFWLLIKSRLGEVGAFQERQIRVAALVMAGLLFLIACLMYPSFAFVVLPLAFVESFYGRKRDARASLVRLAFLGGFYTLVSVVYFVLVKLLIAMFAKQSAVELGSYQFAVNADPAAILDRCLQIPRYMVHSPVLGDWFPAPLLFAFLVLPALILLFDSDRQAQSIGTRVANVALYLVALPAIACGTAAPWLVSHMDGLNARYVLGLDLLILLSVAVSARFLWTRLQQAFSLRVCVVVAALCLIVIAAPVAESRARLVQANIIGAQIEIQHMRSAVKPLVDAGELHHVQRIHIVRPRHQVPVLGYHTHPGQVSASSGAHPEHPFQMLTAVLRDLLPPHKWHEIKLADCRFDESCLATTPKGTIVVSQSEAGQPHPQSPGTLTIDFTLIQR